MILLNHQHLYYFWMVAKEGGVTAACKKLYLAQPTVSAQILQLEKSLNKKLFLREKKRLLLTPDGRRVMNYANEIFGLTHEMLNALRDRPAESSLVSLKLGVDTDVPKQIVTRLMKTIYRQRPQIHVTVYEGAPDELLERLHALSLDLVLSAQGRAVTAGDTDRKVDIGELPIFFVATPRLARRVQIFPRDLSKIPLLLPMANSPLWNSVEQFLMHREVKPPVIAEIQDVDLLRLAALEGLGAAPLHEASVAADLRAGRLIRLSKGPTGIRKKLWLITRKYPRQNTLPHFLVDHFRLNRKD